jgi:hypothetical protein
MDVKSLAEMMVDLASKEIQQWIFNTPTYGVWLRNEHAKKNPLMNSEPNETREQQLEKQLKLMTEWSDRQMVTDRKNQETMIKLHERVVYLTTLLIAINESETTKSQWDELLMVLQLTVPDRHEINRKLKYADANQVLSFLSDEDLK